MDFILNLTGANACYFGFSPFMVFIYVQYRLKFWKKKKQMEMYIKIQNQDFSSDDFNLFELLFTEK